MMVHHRYFSKISRNSVQMFYRKLSCLMLNYVLLTQNVNYSAISTEMKIAKYKIKYEDNQRLSSMAYKLGLAISTVNTIMKAVSRIKETVSMKSTIIT